MYEFGPRTDESAAFDASDAPEAPEAEPEPSEAPDDVDPVDAHEQALVVEYDEDDYR